MSLIIDRLKKVDFHLKGHFHFVFLALIILLAAYLRFYLLGSGGLGNLYYAAAVKSMLISWHNFFFAVLEPSGSISIDKPPVDFWLQAASTQVFGFNGFALAFPNALAGVLSIPLIFFLVRQISGTTAGLASALVLALNPVSVAVERNNDVDGLLTFVLLLSAYFIWRSVASGKVRYLFVGAFLVGIGFNIKMLEAFLPLPAFYILYLVSAKYKWWKRFLHLFLAGLVILVISLSWAVIVDSTPSASRPFVGSTRDNSEVSLALGYNGLGRFIPGVSFANLFNPAATPINTANLTPTPQENQISLTPTLQKTPVNGPPGPLRLFEGPLAENIGWFLPVGFLTIILLLAFFLIENRNVAKRPSGASVSNSTMLQALILWGGWLVIEYLFFSFSGGSFHPYYFATMGPPLAGLVGALVCSLIKITRANRWLGWTLVLVVVTVTALFQASIIIRFDIALPMLILIGTACLIGMSLLAWRPQSWPAKMAVVFLCIGMLAAPFVWSISITLRPKVDNSPSPTADLIIHGQLEPLLGGSTTPPPLLSGANLAFVKYLEEKSPPAGYLIAVNTAPQADPIILMTGYPVLVIGGFIGDDPVFTLLQFVQFVERGELRFVILNNSMQTYNLKIYSWVKSNCSQMAFPTGNISSPLRTEEDGETLFDCALLK